MNATPEQIRADIRKLAQRFDTEAKKSWAGSTSAVVDRKTCERIAKALRWLLRQVDERDSERAE